MSSPVLQNNPAFSNRTLSADELRRIYDSSPSQAPQQQQQTAYPQQAPAPGQYAPYQQGGYQQNGYQQAPYPQHQQQAPATAADVLGNSANPMTLENTISKTFGLFAIMLATAVVGWIFPMLAIPGAIVALVLGLVIAFKKNVNVPLIMIYAVAEGLFVGGISRIFEAQWQGIIFQAVLGTAVVFGVTLALFRSGLVRVSAKANKIFMIAVLSYAAFSLVNFVLMLSGAVKDPWGLRGVTNAGI
ncbi:MAG: Bax inhibitor-1/YccA family protein, partial [Microbacteriaceae bacterium]|nr:Bax inhibitor-1/YccA family protein [Microbacteriaceae bacterium]